MPPCECGKYCVDASWIAFGGLIYGLFISFLVTAVFRWREDRDLERRFPSRTVEWRPYTPPTGPPSENPPDDFGGDWAEYRETLWAPDRTPVEPMPPWNKESTE
jgi:hypothetical protein